MEDSILEPLDLYNFKLKDLHHKNTTHYFDELVKRSGIHPEENQQTIAKYKQKQQKLSHVEKKIAKYKTIRAFLILFGVLFVIGAGILIYMGIEKILPLWLSILLSVLLIGLTISFFVINKKKIQVILKDNDLLRKKLMDEISQLKDTAWKQMKPLNDLYDWNMPAQIMSQTTPLIQMDQYFDAKKYQYLAEKYGFMENTDEHSSTVLVQSGSILGNPFLICRNYKQLWISKVYTGSITIHWTEHTRDSKGNLKTVTRSQVLTASVTKPVPNYEYETYLIYGNDAAPNLIFSRKPSNIGRKSEKDIEKVVKSGAKKLDDKARDAVTKNESYTRLGNDEFEVLFGGEDRNNELEFRLLFTPLAQKNELKLIKSKYPYGDDFYFNKYKQLNLIQSAHSQRQDYYANPNMFVDFDYEEARKRFIEYNCQYFQSIYFDLAPLISIPLYQQHKPREYIYKQEYRSNITSFEHEVLANTFNDELLKHKESETNLIIKTKFEKKNKEADRVKIEAHSFKTVQRIETIMRHGGDGHMHAVPVPWTEYLPICNESYMEVKAEATTRYDFNHLKKDAAFMAFMKEFTRGNAFTYERGLIAALLAKEISDQDVDRWNTVLKKGNISNQNNNFNQRKEGE